MRPTRREMLVAAVSTVALAGCAGEDATETTRGAAGPVAETATASPTPTESAGLTTFEREDGSLQVAANGWPLYYFADDEEPGDANGQGANDVWWVLRPDGTVVRSEDAGTDAGEGDHDHEGTETDADRHEGDETETSTEDGSDYPAVERR